MRLNWTQPVCIGCYQQNHPEMGDPVRFLEAGLEYCCHCGLRTLEGIYERIDPRTVRYPAAYVR